MPLYITINAIATAMKQGLHDKSAAVGQGLFASLNACGLRFVVRDLR